MTAAAESSPELLTLHAVRLKGMADDDEIAARFGLEPAVVGESLLDFQAVGWVTKVDFAGTGRWALTALGHAENERQLADELSALSHDLRDACLTLGGQLARFGGYDHRFAAALERAERGEHSWVNRPRADSCHTVWMELHEDLLATLGIQRGSESSTPV